MALHKNLTETDLHETKGVSTASAGQIHTCISPGVSGWENIHGYGGIVRNDAGGTPTISAIGVTPKKLNIFTHNAPSVNGTVPDYTTGSITINTAGKYYVLFYGSFGTVAVGDSGIYQIRLRINDVEPSAPYNLGVSRYMSGTNDVGSVTFFGVIDITAGDVISAWIESDDGADSDDIKIYDLSLTVYKV